jgi:hypothetical protein
MIAIETRKLPATNTKPSRYVATMIDGHRLVLSEDYALNNGANHWAVAQRLADSLVLGSSAGCGDTKAGMVFLYMKR